MEHTWRKPDSINLQAVRRRGFEANGKDFRIELLQEDAAKEEALDLIMSLLKNDPIFSAFGFSSDPDSTLSLKEWVKMYLDLEISSGCYHLPEEGPRVLVAVDVMYVRKIHDDSDSRFQDKGEAFKGFIQYLEKIDRDICDHIDDKIKNPCYLTSFGIFTLLEYRNIVDIPTEMLLVRENIADLFETKIIAAPFIGTKMQRVASKCNYKALNQREELKEQEMDCRALPILLMKSEKLKRNWMKRMDIKSKTPVQNRYRPSHKQSDYYIQCKKATNVRFQASPNQETTFYSQTEKQSMLNINADSPAVHELN